MEPPKPMTVVVGQKGRVVLPAPLRQALGFDVGTELIARIEDGALVLETREMAWERLRAMFDHIPPEVSLVDELLAERQLERERERKEWG